MHWCVVEKMGLGIHVLLIHFHVQGHDLNMCLPSPHKHGKRDDPVVEETGRVREMGILHNEIQWMMWVAHTSIGLLPGGVLLFPLLISLSTFLSVACEFHAAIQGQY